MSATRDLIAAALTAADKLDEFKYSDLQRAATTLREMCARAMVQPAAPDMGEVPMPQGYAEHPSDYTGSIWIESQMRQYGDASEAAGYARGLAETGKDAERYRWLRRKFAIIGTDCGAVFHALNLPSPTHIAPDAAIELDAAIDAALRGDVKP